jgi:Raf kinase inhibitor-like YbhB/YbcL family protein
MFVIMLTAALYAGPAQARAAAAHGGNAPRASRQGAGQMQVSTKSFSAGGDIPKRYTCDGADISPQLSWSEAPAGTRSLVLIADDPDAPRGTWTHWVVYDLPPGTRELAEGAGKGDQLPGGGSQGRNDFGKTGYNGPCPPPGKPHRYFFRIFTLDKMLGLKPGASRKELEAAMQGHVLGQGEVMGRYGR